MGWFGGHPGTPVVVDGKDTFPLVPVAVGLYSAGFNIFNTAIMFPSSPCFTACCRVSAIPVSRIVTIPSRAIWTSGPDFTAGVACVQREDGRYLEGAAQLMAIARDAGNAPDDAQEHYEALDILSREIRSYTAAMFQPNLSYEKADLLAENLIEEEIGRPAFGETLYQIARRAERETFSGRPVLVDAMLDKVGDEHCAHHA